MVLIRRNSLRMNEPTTSQLQNSNEIDACSMNGQFAWEEISENVTFPVIYRNEQKEKYVSYKLLEVYVFPQIYSSILHPQLKMFEFIPKQQMTQREAALFNEINVAHCDAKYNLTFAQSDLIVSMDNVQAMLTYLEMVYKKLMPAFGFVVSNFGLIKIIYVETDKHIIVPYVKRDEEMFIPRDSLKGPILSHLNFFDFTPIEMQYVKVLYRVMKSDIKIKQSNNCFMLTDFLGRTKTKYEEYWPRMEEYDTLILS